MGGSRNFAKRDPCLDIVPFVQERFATDHAGLSVILSLSRWRRQLGQFRALQLEISGRLEPPRSGREFDRHFPIMSTSPVDDLVFPLGFGSVSLFDLVGGDAHLIGQRASAVSA